MTRTLIIAIVVIAAIACFLCFTKPEHRALASLGFGAACSSSDGCDN